MKVPIQKRTVIELPYYLMNLWILDNLLKMLGLYVKMALLK